MAAKRHKRAQKRRGFLRKATEKTKGEDLPSQASAGRRPAVRELDGQNVWLESDLGGFYSHSGSMNGSLQNRVALVTGASRGLGAAIARGLAERGAKVAVNYFANRERAET